MQFNMMIIAPIAFLASTAIARVVAAEDLSSKDVVENLDSLTKKAADAKNTAGSFTIANSTAAGPAIVEAIKDIVHKASGKISDPDAYPRTQFNGTDKDNICASLHSFAKGQEDFLDTLYGKKSQISMTPYDSSVAAGLRGLKSALDAVFNTINDASPDCKGHDDDKKSVDTAMSKAVDEFAGK